MSGKPVPLHIRRQVIARDGNQCRYCGCRVFLTRHPDCPRPRHCLQRRTMDHIVPSAAGGPTSVDNIVVACQGCNEYKANGALDPPPPPDDPWVHGHPLLQQAHPPCNCPPLPVKQLSLFYMGPGPEYGVRYAFDFRPSVC